MLDALSQQLDQLKADHALRQRRTLESPCGPLARIDGRDFVSFCSNDYLGLANHPALIEAACEGAQRWGVGAGASHLVSGHSAAHDALEKRLAEFVGLPRALFFSTGYMANIGILPALLGRHDAVFADKLNHACLSDSALLSRANHHRYPHGDVSALERLLRTSTARHKIVATDAVFSMDGDIAPLADLLALCERFDAMLLIDDAHGFGVLGPQGRGSVQHAHLQSDRVIYMGTLGKAAGVSGAFVAGHATLIDWLTQRARSYVFTTATPPMIAHTLLTAIDLIEQGDALRAHLFSLITRLKTGLSSSAWTMMPSPTAIQPILLGDNARALAVADALLERGLWLPAIRPPTIPAGQARLRVSITAAHTAEHIDTLIAGLRAIS